MFNDPDTALSHPVGHAHKEKEMTSAAQGQLSGTIANNSHYNGYLLLDLLLSNHIGFSEGSIMKYVFRWKKKNGMEDLLKAKDILDRLIEKEKKICY